MKGTAPPDTCGILPSHFSIALIRASTSRRRISSGSDRLALHAQGPRPGPARRACRFRLGARLRDALFGLDPMRSRSRSALSFCCSATVLASIAASEAVGELEVGDRELVDHQPVALHALAQRDLIALATSGRLVTSCSAVWVAVAFIASCTDGSMIRGSMFSNTPRLPVHPHHLRRVDVVVQHHLRGHPLQVARGRLAFRLRALVITGIL